MKLRLPKNMKLNKKTTDHKCPVAHAFTSLTTIQE